MAADRIKLYLDAHVPRAVAQGLQRRGVDVVRAQETGMIDADDEDHLRYSEKECRVIVTQDADFLRLHSRGVTHCGISYAPQPTPARVIIHGLMLIYELLTPEEMKGHVEFL